MQEKIKPEKNKLQGVSISDLGLMVADHVDVMLVYWDKNEFCRFANSSFSKWIGISRDEMIDRMTFKEILGQTFYEKSLPFFIEVLKGCFPVFDHEIIKPSGEKSYCMVSYFPHIEDENVIGVFAQVEDVTQRKLIEKSFKERNEILERIFETTHFAMVYLDLDFNFIRVNKSYADSCGYPVEFFPGKNHFDLYPGEEVKSVFVKVAETGKPFTIYARPFEFPDHPEWGVTYWDWSLYPTRGDDEKIEGLLFILLDVTENKKAENELRFSQKKLIDLSRHLENMREEERKQIALDLHDQLGQELTGLNIDLHWLHKKLPKENQEILMKINSMIDQVNHTILSMQNLSMKLRPSILDDLGLIAAIDWFQKDFEKRSGIKCKFNSFTESIDLLPEQEINIFRIIQEAFTNIARHSGASHVDITISKEDDFFKILVADNGRGITKAEKDGADSFGLQGMHARASTCGGKLIVQSEIGLGTIINLLIPVNFVLL